MRPNMAPIICLSTKRISNISYLVVSSLENAFFQRLVLLDMNIYNLLSEYFDLQLLLIKQIYHDQKS